MNIRSLRTQSLMRLGWLTQTCLCWQKWRLLRVSCNLEVATHLLRSSGLRSSSLLATLSWKLLGTEVKFWLVPYDLRNNSFSIHVYNVVLLLVNHHKLNAATDLTRAIKWTKANQLYSLEFQKRGLALGALLRIWDGDNFRRVAIGVLDREWCYAWIVCRWSVVTAVGSSASAVAIFGESHFLLRHMHNTWAVCTWRDWLSTQSFICGCWRNIFKK